MSSSIPIVTNTDFMENGFSIQDLLVNFNKEMEKIRLGLSLEQQGDFDTRYMLPLQNLINSKRFEGTGIIDDYKAYNKNRKLSVEKRDKDLKLPHEMIQLMRVFNGESDISGKFSLQYSIKTEADKQVFKVMVQYLEKLKEPGNRAKLTAPTSASVVKKAAFYATVKVVNTLAPTEKVNKKIEKLIDKINAQIQSSEQQVDEEPGRGGAGETVEKKPLEQVQNPLQNPLERIQKKIDKIKANAKETQKSTWSTLTKRIFGTIKKGPTLVSTQETDGAKPSLNIKPEEIIALQSTFDTFKDALEDIAKGNVEEKALLKAQESMRALTAKEKELGITLSEEALNAYNIALKVGEVANLEELFNHCVAYFNFGNSDGLPFLIDARNKLIDTLEAQSQTPELLLKVKEVNSQFENIINDRVEQLTKRAKQVTDKPAFEEIEKILKDLNFETMEKYKKTEDSKKHKLPETTPTKLEALRIEVATTKLIATPPSPPQPLTFFQKISKKFNKPQPFKPKKNDLRQEEQTTSELPKNRTIPD